MPITTRRLAATLLLFLSALLAGRAQAQSTGILTIPVESDRIRWDACRISVTDSVPSGVRTDILQVRLVRERTDIETPAPFGLTVRVGARDMVAAGDSVLVPKGDSTAVVYLTRTRVRGSPIVVARTGAEGVLCERQLEPEEDPREVDPSFSLFAGVEFLSGDGFSEREVHFPAAALWSIPVRVSPLDTVRVLRNEAARARARSRYPDSDDDPYPSPISEGDTTRYRYRGGNVYSIFTAGAEFTRLLSEQTFLTCAGSTVPRGGGGGDAEEGAECADPQPAAGDSVRVFREREDSTDWATLSAWRIYGNFRWEWNMRWADRDVFLGPAVMLGFQTDPGLGSQDFFGIATAGVSMTQVEITDEYFAERFQLQVLYGWSPNYARDVVTQTNNATLRRSVEVPSSRRLHVKMSFQPFNGYFLRGSAEFGKSTPDVARIAIVTQLDLERIVRGIFGDKDRPVPGF